MGRFLSPDKPGADQHTPDPQSWNLYAYVRNNPLTALDSTGKALQLLGATPEQRQSQLEGLKDSLVGSKQAERLYINPEKDAKGQETGRYFLGVNGGDLKSFAAGGLLESNMAEIIDSKTIVDFGFGSRLGIHQDGLMDKIFNRSYASISENGGAGTYDADYSATGHVTSMFNPGHINAVPSMRFLGDDAPNPTLGETISHELAHALGRLKGLMGNRSNRMAVDAENDARKRGGKEREQRSTHDGGFPK
jgi:hypothetical protein